MAITTKETSEAAAFKIKSFHDLPSHKTAPTWVVATYPSHIQNPS
jgi:hypothetical protein